MKKYGLAIQNALVEEALETKGLVSNASFVVRTPDELRAIFDDPKLNVDYLFFPHWSHIVTEKIYEQIECVCFHSTPLPYGRGGSPVQNMILRGFEQTEICALRMTKKLDAGPVYLRLSQSLNGPAHQIFSSIYKKIAGMMIEMLTHDLEPIEQQGSVTQFKRLSGADNELPTLGSINSLYDHIRMTDADAYPSAWLRYGDWVLEFRDAVLNGDRVSATVNIRRSDGNHE
tara:strand:- start:2256 stop:2945 length:690 start_codon:yes stop_codon:yes gene_type:complete